MDSDLSSTSNFTSMSLGLFIYRMKGLDCGLRFSNSCPQSSNGLVKSLQPKGDGGRRAAQPQCQLQAEETYGFSLLHNVLPYKAFIWNKNASVPSHIKNSFLKKQHLARYLKKLIWGREQFSHFLSLHVRVHSKYTIVWYWQLRRSHFILFF